MKIAVCVRQALDGEISPFDACAYEEALRIEGAEVVLVSMGPPSAENFLKNLTRLGAKEVFLLTDPAFAGADTLATAYALSKAIEIIKPDLVFCGRQTLVGDTAQTGVMLSVLADLSLITNVMQIMSVSDGKITCKTRSEGEKTVNIPALLTVERINNLRLPRLRSKLGEVTLLSRESLNADAEKCGLKGSPTRVLSTRENEGGKRKCKFISLDELDSAIKESLAKNSERIAPAQNECGEKLSRVMCIGTAPLEFAKTISDDISVVEMSGAENLAEIIKQEKPNAVLWASDSESKRVSSLVAARLSLGLCADCTSLETDGKELFMIRPALSGSVIAKIKSLTTPAMATVRTAETDTPDIIVAAGFGAKDSLEKVKSFAEKLGAGMAATRKAVDNSLLPYEMQVGLTGKTVSPPVYIAVGVSGAVHHIVGMKRSTCVIAINPDKDAPIFDYADYGILTSAQDL